MQTTPAGGEMKTRKILDLLEEALRLDRSKHSRREREVRELLDKLAAKEKKLLAKLAEPHDLDEIRTLNLKLQVNRASQAKANAALDSWALSDDEPEPAAPKA